MRVYMQADFKLFGQIKKKGKWFVANCPPLDVTTQGKTLEKAQNNLIEASQLFIISCLERGTLDQALKELGIVPLSGSPKQQSMPENCFQFPVPIPFGFEKQIGCRA